MKKFSKQLFRDILFIAVAAAAAAFVINLFHPRGYVLVSRSDFDNKRVVFITAEEAKIKYDSKAALFIDARETAEYDASHISGSVSIPAGDPFPGPGGELQYREQPKEIVIYCDGSSCGASELLARKILSLTPRHVYIIEKGFPDWKAHGFPVREGE
ncbi:MAG: hypothetical protein A2W19_05840 [Spirochaetes bacterium RBG_16_49_21]|nr:MAG: hypothetical protein A2W19_05840 [Spirochaetes bacterium RBG_16_49_21]